MPAGIRLVCRVRQPEEGAVHAAALSEHLLVRGSGAAGTRQAQIPALHFTPTDGTAFGGRESQGPGGWGGGLRAALRWEAALGGPHLPWWLRW